MQVTVTTIIFGLPQGQRTSQVEVDLPSSTLSLRDLIAYKIEREIAEIGQARRTGLSGEYLTPEALILATSLDALQPGAVDDEIHRAQQAFASRDFMIAIDDGPMWDANAVIDIQSGMRIEFIKILPLVGG